MLNCLACVALNDKPQKGPQVPSTGASLDLPECSDPTQVLPNLVMIMCEPGYEKKAWQRSMTPEDDDGATYSTLQYL